MDPKLIYNFWLSIKPFRSLWITPLIATGLIIIIWLWNELALLRDQYEKINTEINIIIKKKNNGNKKFLSWIIKNNLNDWDYTFLKISDAFVPPKPNEFESEYVKLASLAVLGV